MAQVIIIPTLAETEGCGVSLVGHAFSRTSHGGYEHGTWYSIKVKTAKNWKFLGATAERYERSVIDGVAEESRSIVEPGTTRCADSEWNFPDEDWHGESRITWVKAEFVYTGHDDIFIAKASVSVTPQEAADAGCKAFVEPAIEYGHAGESAHFLFTAVAAYKWKFVSWDDGYTSSEHGAFVTFGPEREKSYSLTATFKYDPKDCTVNAVANVDGQDAIMGGCRASAAPVSQDGLEGEMTSISFSAFAGKDWEFVSWSDGSTDAVHTVNVAFGPEETKTVSLTAYFTKRQRIYTIIAHALVSPEEAEQAGCSATVDKSVTQGRYGEVESFTFVANAAAGWKFKGWSDGSSDVTHTVVVAYGPDNYKYFNLTAEFEKNVKIVTVSVSPPNAGNAEGAGEFRTGTTARISTSERCSPWIFSHWELTPGGRVEVKDYSFVVNEYTDCIAHYRHSDTGKLYDVDGKILCNSSGDILYDGDLVTA